MKHALTAAWWAAASVLSIAPLAAQGPAPQAPGAAAPATDPAIEQQRNTAAKLAGMIRFVATSCPNLEPDYDRFKRVIAGLGVDIKDLENGELMGRSISYGRAYQKDGEASCERALPLFGESGRVIPGLVARKAAAKPGDGPSGTPPQPPSGEVPAGAAPEPKP